MDGWMCRYYAFLPFLTIDTSHTRGAHLTKVHVVTLLSHQKSINNITLSQHAQTTTKHVTDDLKPGIAP